MQQRFYVCDGTTTRGRLEQQAVHPPLFPLRMSLSSVWVGGCAVRPLTCCPSSASAFLSAMATPPPSFISEIDLLAPLERFVSKQLSPLRVSKFLRKEFSL